MFDDEDNKIPRQHFDTAFSIEFFFNNFSLS